MPHSFDTTTKYLLDNYISDWLPHLGIKTSAPVKTLNANMAELSGDADRFFLVEDVPPFVLHAELQSAWDDTLLRRTLLYSAWGHHVTNGLSVYSVIMLLRRSADRPALTGKIFYQAKTAESSLEFRIKIVRLWELPVDEFLNGGLGVVPLAPLCNVAEADLPSVISRMDERISKSANEKEAGTLWTAAYILMGLRHPPSVVDYLLRGVRNMEESATYQAILAKGNAKGKAEGKAEGEAEGGAKEARRLVIRTGTRRCGLPNERILAALEQIDSIERLEELHDRAMEAKTWDEVL